MIVNDAPTIGGVAEDKREATMRVTWHAGALRRRVAGPFEFPAPERNRGSRAKLFDFEI